MNLLKKILSAFIVAIVKVYQAAISPWLGKSCRYSPTCSHYMIEAVNEWGPLQGFWMGIKRIGRCHPWGGDGYDPVPQRKLNKEGSSSNAKQDSLSDE